MPKDYKDKTFILDGIKHGFKITDSAYEGPTIKVNNHKSAVSPTHKGAVQQQIETEIMHGRYRVVNKEPRIVSALGAIPKDNGKIRLVHDCSRPVGNAVNDLAINQKFSYASVDNAMALIKPTSYLAKLDLSSAYRSVGIHPEDYPVAGLAWQFKGENTETFMVDTCLMFGSSKGPFIFNTLTVAVCHIMSTNGFPGVVSYLDDFILIGDSYDCCMGHLNTLITLVRKLGFYVNYSKVEGPVQAITFLGVHLDTLDMTASLPQDKLDDLNALIKCTWEKPSVTKRHLQRLAGKLVWAARLIKLGRAHVRRLFTLIHSLDHPSQRTKLDSPTRQDLLWWLTCSSWANRSLPIQDTRERTPLTIDACGYGGGGFFNGQGYHVVWQEWPGAEELCINYKEVIVLLPAVRIWAAQWSNKVINVHSDNQCAVAIINRGTAKHPMVMQVLRQIAWAAATWNFDLRAYYYPGERNVLADCLSRIPALPAVRTLTNLLGDNFVKSCTKWRPQDSY